MNVMRPSTIIVASFCATSAFAEVTAQQVWDNWSEQMAIYGDGFTTTGETMSGDTLTISGVRIEFADPEASVVAELGDILLTENGDGTVTITMAETYPITLNMTPLDGEQGTVNLAVTHDDMALIASGDVDAMSYALSANRYEIAVISIEAENEVDFILDTATFALVDLSGQYSVTEDTLTRITYDFDAAAIDIDAAFRDVAANDAVSFTGDIADLALAAVISAPIDMDMNADAPPFDEGLGFTGSYSFGQVDYAFDLKVEGEMATGTMGVDGGNLAIGIDVDGMTYTGETRGMSVSMQMPSEFPVPIDVSLEKYGFDVQAPLSMGDGEPRDARFGFNVTGLEASDLLWDIFDPQMILPRDPLTVALTLDAQVTPFFDFLDPAQQEAAAMSDIPGEINGLQIVDFVIRGGGADITGDGAFTFDNSDLTTFDGLPRPEGQASFAINGVNALIDNLVAMGLVPAEEVMMPRMMMGMFTTPVGDDQLTFTVEVNEEGHVLANGQRLR